MLFVVDAKAGVTPGDEELAEILRSSRRDVLVIANKLDDPRRDAEALEFHRLGLGDPIPLSALHGHGTGDLLDDDRRAASGRQRATGRGGGDPRRDPRPPERRQVVAPECAPRPRARDRLGGSGHDARRDRHGASARRANLRARGHCRASAQAQAASGDRVLLGAPRARGGRARRRRPRRRRRERGRRRPGPRGRRRGPQGAVRDRRRSSRSGT